MEIQLKRHQHPNAVIQYRYDVAVHTGNRVRASVSCETLDWNAFATPLADIEQALTERRSRAFRLTSVCNARLALTRGSR